MTKKPGSKSDPDELLDVGAMYDLVRGERPALGPALRLNDLHYSIMAAAAQAAAGSTASTFGKKFPAIYSFWEQSEHGRISEGFGEGAQRIFAALRHEAESTIQWYLETGHLKATGLKFDEGAADIGAPERVSIDPWYFQIPSREARARIRFEYHLSISWITSSMTCGMSFTPEQLAECVDEDTIGLDPFSRPVLRHLKHRSWGYLNVAVDRALAEQMWPAIVSELGEGGASERDNRRRPGRPGFDWDPLIQELIRRADNPDGLPRDFAEIVSSMKEWAAQHWLKPPSDSALQDALRRYVGHIKPKAKALSRN